MRLVFFLILLFTSTVHAKEIEAFAGANYTTYDDVSEANSYSISARAKMNFYDNGRGYFVSINAPAISLIASDIMGGYAWRSRGDVFYEAGGGPAFSCVFGFGLVAMAGIGFRVNSDFYVNFPLVLRWPTGISWTPYIGYVF